MQSSAGRDQGDRDQGDVARPRTLPAFEADRTRLVEELGRGAGAVVYRAERDGRRYAVKVLAGEPSAEHVAAFAREAALLASLRHPSLVDIYEVGLLDGRPYLIMELIEGRSLSLAIQQDRFDTARVANLGAQLAEALGVAHRAGLVHRDVKPDNILIEPDGRARLIDFGLVARVDDNVRDEAVGTFFYSAPEQSGMLHRPVDGRADLYALGIVMFECLTGQLPFNSHDTGELLRLHLTAPVPDIGVLRPDVDPALVAVITRMMAKDPDDRYLSAEEAYRALSALAAAGPNSATVGPVEHHRPARRVPMVGRDGELATLRSGWDRSIGGAGLAMLVTGSAGLGKSRLADELAWQVRALGKPLLRSTASAEQQFPLAPLIAALEHHLAAIAALPGPLRASQTDMLVEVAGSAAGLLTRFLPTLGELIGVPEEAGPDLGPAGAAPLASVDADRFAEVVTGYLVGLAEATGGALLLLEDAQWWDEATRAIVHRLATALRDSRLMLLVTARDEDSGSDNDSDTNTNTDTDTEIESGTAPGGVAQIAVALGPALETQVRIQPLSPGDVTTMATLALGGGQVPELLLSRLASGSGGNPLAVLEYLRAALEAGVVLPYWGTWRVDEAGLDALRLPANIFDLLLRRVDELGPTARELLVVAAAIGTQFSTDLVRAVLRRWGVAAPGHGAAAHGAAGGGAAGGGVSAGGGVTADAAEADDASEVEGSLVLAAALDEALGQRLIEPAGSGFAFPHERIRQTLLDRLEEPRRHSLHQTIAEVLEASESLETSAVYAIAHHYLAGEPDRRPDLLFRATAAAGQRAFAEYASMQAYDYFKRAGEAAAAAGIDPDARFHEAFGLAANMVGEYEVTQDQVQRALAKEPDPTRRGLLYAWLAESHHVQWQGRQAMEMGHLGLAEMGRSLPRSPGKLLVTSMTRLLGARILSWLPLSWRLLEGERRERALVEAHLLTVIGESAAYAMQMPLSVTTSTRRRIIAVRLGSGPEQVADLHYQAILAEAFGRRKKSEQLFVKAFALAESMGDPATLARLHLVYALNRDSMRPPDTKTGIWFRKALVQHGQWLPASDYLLASSQLGLFELTRGNLAEATVWYERGLRRVAANGTYGNPTMALGASIAALSGNPVEAASRLREVQAFAASDPTNTAARANAALTATHVAMEQGELGTPFDEAVAEFNVLKLRPRQVFMVQRTFWIFQAFGRLAQAAGASPKDRAERLAAARTAVRELRVAAAGSLYGAYATVAEAWLDQMDGQPAAALRRLAPLDAAEEGHNSTLVDYEIARVRARAFADLDRPAESLRQAQLALMLAIEHGWHTRARWVRAEFALAATVGTVRPSTALGSVLAPSSELTSQMRRLQAVHQVGVAAAAVLEPRQLCRVALDETVRILAAERAFLFLVDTETDELLPYLGRDSVGNDLETLTGYGASLVQRVRDTAEALVVTGSEQGAAMGSRSALIHGLRSIIVAPVQFKDRLLGVFYLDSRAARGIFTPDDVSILSAISHQVAVTFETARAAKLESDIRTAQRERDLAEMLRLAIMELSARLDPDDVIEHMISLVSRAAPVDTWSLLQYTDDHTVVAMDPALGSSLVDGTDPVVKRLLTLDEPLRGSEGTAGLGSVADQLDGATRAWMALPLVVRGARRGALLLGTAQPHTYTDAEVRIAAILAGQGMTAYDNAQLFRQIGELATKDGLTGLFNRRHFFELAGPWVDETRQHPRPVAAVMVDIDFFKKINDTYGHGIGDEVICEVANRLSRCLRSDDVICRYGGEEFAVLLTGTSAEQAEMVGARLHEAVRAEPVDTSAGQLAVTVSVGVTVPDIEPGDLQALLNDADRALYAAKRAGRNQMVRNPTR